MCVVSTLLLTFPLAVRVGGRTREEPEPRILGVCLAAQGHSSPQRDRARLGTGVAPSRGPEVSCPCGEAERGSAIARLGVAVRP